MRCYICDRIMTQDEIRFDEQDRIEPCGVCRAAIKTDLEVGEIDDNDLPLLDDAKE